MAKRYHVNPVSGEPGPCQAKERCPFGGLEADHYPSVDAARAGYEAVMRDNVVAGDSGSGPFSPVLLSSVLDLELLRSDIAGGYIASRPHDDDPNLLVLCYTKETQYEGHWTDATKIARGLIIRASDPSLADGIIEQRPWKKFFTLEQMESGWHLGDEEGGSAGDDELARLDFHAPAEVTDKVDGSMGILYHHPKGGVALSTKGSFGSEQALYYTRMLDRTGMGAEAEALMAEHPDTTFLFELVGRNNRIVLDYPEDGIVLLGAVKKHNGIYLSANEYADRWSGGVTETLTADNVGAALALPDRPGREGIVIRVLSDDPDAQMQLKVKQDEYKRLHRVVTGFGASDLRTSIRDTEASAADLIAVAKSGDVRKLQGVKDQLDLLANHPMLAGVLEDRERIYREAILPRLENLSAAHDRVASIPNSFFSQENPSKAFAAEIAKEAPDLKPDLFTFFQARLRGQSLDTVNGGRILGSIAREVKAEKLIPSETQ